MSPSLRADHLRVHRDLARLLLKHGQRDLVEQAGLSATPDGDDAPTTAPDGLFASMLATKELLEQLPGRINRILGALADGELTVNVDSIDEDRLLSGLRQVANRITTGLILAALIIGAAMLMGVETETTILGYPALAMVFFLIAAVGGLVLVITIALGGRGDRRR